MFHILVCVFFLCFLYIDNVSLGFSNHSLHREVISVKHHDVDRFGHRIVCVDVRFSPPNVGQLDGTGSSRLVMMRFLRGL